MLSLEASICWGHSVLEKPVLVHTFIYILSQNKKFVRSQVLLHAPGILGKITDWSCGELSAKTCQSIFGELGN